MPQEESDAVVTLGPSHLPYEDPVNMLLPAHFDRSAKLISYREFLREADDDGDDIQQAILKDKFQNIVTKLTPPVEANIEVCSAWTGAAMAMDPVVPDCSPWFFSITLWTQEDVRRIPQLHAEFLVLVEEHTAQFEDWPALIRYRLGEMDVDY